MAEAALRELLLSTSYDLRVNTQNVQAASTLLLAQPAVAADEEAAFLADAIHSSCNLLLGIVSNVIEMRKLERGELALSPQPFDPAAALRDVLRSCAFGLQRGAAGLRWENEAEAETALPPLIEADLSHVRTRGLDIAASLLRADIRAIFIPPPQVSQIVQNLVTNAIKFSRGSEVRVTARTEDAPGATAPLHPPMAGPASAATPAMLRVAVADAGAGLTAEDCERIFRVFEHAAPEKGGGTGLGLHISRAFARAMGGDVTVESQVGVGSTYVPPCFFHDCKLTRLFASASRCGCLSGCSRASSPWRPAWRGRPPSAPDRLRPARKPWLSRKTTGRPPCSARPRRARRRLRPPRRAATATA